MHDLTQSPAWQKLTLHSHAIKRQKLSDLVRLDRERLKSCTICCDGLRLNYALQSVTTEIIDLVVARAQQQKVEDMRAAMWCGEAINNTENRAVLHVALRQQSDAPVMVKGRNVLPDILAVRQGMAAFSDKVRSGAWKGHTGKAIKHIVNIGIGGSDLGPRMVVRALSAFNDRLSMHFVANADAADLRNVVKNISADETLFIVVSKTFTTQETILNAQAARQWMVENLGEDSAKEHFVAVSSNLDAARAFGIDAANIFPMWDWVGGRFSLWSAVGLSIMLAIGSKNFDDLCRGAAAMDTHFQTAPLNLNMPVMLALLGVWQRNFMGASSLAVITYAESLFDLPHYLQQLDMESNGKSVTRDGRAVDYATAPLVFGERGTVGQHSFHQWLHQGTDACSVDFIGVETDDLGQPISHDIMLANLAAQSLALAFGRPDAKTPHEVYAGGRACNILMLDRLDPYCLGMLLALYEHKIFVQGIIWDINSFDQPGVELGKEMARSLQNGMPLPGASGTLGTSLMEWVASKP